MESNLLRGERGYAVCPNQQHRNQPLLHVCMNAGCASSPLVCVSCIQTTHINHRILPLAEFQQQLSNMKFDQSISKEVNAHDLATKELKIRKANLFQKARKELIEKIDLLEKGVDEYMDGLAKQIENQSTEHIKSTAVPMEYDHTQPVRVVMVTAGRSVTNYLANQKRRTELQAAIPEQTTKLKTTFGIVEEYITKMINQDSSTTKEFMKFMTDNGYVRAGAWQERPEQDNRRFLQQIKYADLGKGPQQTPKSIWSRFWYQNQLKIWVVIALLVLLMGVGIHSALGVTVVNLNTTKLLKNSMVMAAGKTLIRSNANEKNSWACVAIDSPLSDMKSVYQLSAFLMVKKEELALGVCSRKAFSGGDFRYSPGQPIGRQCQLLATDGKAYSSWDAAANVWRLDWSIDVGQTFRMSYQPSRNKLSFSHNDQFLTSMKTMQKNDYVAVVCFCGNNPGQTGSTISIL